MAGAKPRYVFLDVLRGFAIMAILLIHSSNHFLYGIMPVGESEWLASLDSGVRDVLYFLFEGKSYAIFAMLFGLSYALQYDNQRKRGGDFGWRMIWRLLWLLLFGALNAVFFSGGDPLVFYALCMVVVVPLRRASIKWLWVVAVVMIMQPLELINHFAPFIDNLHYDYYEELTPYTVEGDFFAMAWANVTVGLKACLMWAVETGRFTQTIGLFLLGMIIYRKRWFAIEGRVLRRALMVAFLFLVNIFVVNLAYPNPWVTMIYNLAFAAFMVLSIMSLYQMTKGGALWRAFAKLGQMSLTNFVAQSVICSFLFYPWGLHLSPYLGVTASVLVGVGVGLFQVAFSTWWLRHHRRGPLEGIWHTLTWVGAKK